VFEPLVAKLAEIAVLPPSPRKNTIPIPYTLHEPVGIDQRFNVATWLSERRIRRIKDKVQYNAALERTRRLLVRNFVTSSTGLELRNTDIAILSRRGLRRHSVYFLELFAGTVEKKARGSPFPGSRILT
jgi:hypothetical protein